jgi:hypothetical protein
VDLVARPRAAAHQLRAPRDPAAQDPGLLVADPGARQHPGSEQLGQHLRVDAIVLDLRVRHRTHVARVGDQDRAGVRLENPGDAQRVAGRLQRKVVIGAQALREQLQLFGRAGDAARGADLAVLADRDVAEVAMGRPGR